METVFNLYTSNYYICKNVTILTGNIQFNTKEESFQLYMFGELICTYVEFMGTFSRGISGSILNLT